jgi:hypothetical protein
MLELLSEHRGWILSCLIDVLKIRDKNWSNHSAFEPQGHSLICMLSQMNLMSMGIS